MSARQLIVLAVAAVAAIGALFLIRTLGSNRPAQSEQTAEAVSGVQVLVVARDVPQGAALTASAGGGIIRSVFNDFYAPKQHSRTCILLLVA